MAATTLSCHSSRNCDEVPSGHKRKLLVHPLLDEQFVIGASIAGRVFCHQAPSFEFQRNQHLDSIWVEPPDSPSDSEALSIAPVCKTEPIPEEEPLRDSNRLGLLCAGLQHWGVRRKVQYVGRQRETPTSLFIKKETSLTEPVVVKRVWKKPHNSTEKERRRKKPKSEEETVTSSCSSWKHRWSKKRYKAAELKLMDLLREKGAVLGNPILRPVLRSEARKHISDTGLLDHLLKHMAGKVDKERGERLCRRHNADGTMEYWIESAELVELRKQAGVKDPYWIPPPGWKPGDSLYDSETSRELKLLKEGMCNTMRYLERLLSEKHEGEDGIDALGFGCQPDPELISSLEMSWTQQSYINPRVKLEDNQYYDTETARELNQLMEGMGNMKRYLEELLSRKSESEEVDNPPNLTKGSQSNPESTSSLERGWTNECFSYSKDRWSKERYEWAQQKLLEIMREKGAVLGNPLLRPALRLEARKHIGDTGLLDHLLKHMAGKVDKERGERICRRHNSDGAMEYWLENAFLVELRRKAGVKDPYWMPPPGWKPGDKPYLDSETSIELNQLKEEMGNMKRYLERLLLDKNDCEEGHNAMILTNGSHIESTSSLEVGWDSQGCNLMGRWSMERYELAFQKVLNIIREKRAVMGNPISWSVLRSEAIKYVGDVGLLDHLLNDMVGKVDKERGERLCQHSNQDGVREYWLESMGMVDPQKDPYWIEPLEWELRGNLDHGSKTTWRLKQLKEVLGNIKRSLEPLLVEKHEIERDNALSLTTSSQTDL